MISACILMAGVCIYFGLDEVAGALKEIAAAIKSQRKP
jgi:hypothetical protein